MSRSRPTSPDLVGRRLELAALAAHETSARAGEGRVVFVSGEAGVGKSRLLRAFLAGREDVLAGHCFEENPTLPYGPFVDALLALTRRWGLEAVARAAGPLAGSLAALLPGIAAGEEGDLEPPVKKRRLFEAVFQVLRPPSGASRVVLLEDLHWSDGGSQELLRFFARAAESERLLVLTSYRSDELHRHHPLSGLLAQLGRERRLFELRLAPFAEDELAAVLAPSLERPLPAPLLRAIHERSGGNPFFAEELLAALVESGRVEELASAHGRALELPLSVKDSVLRRVADLDARSAEVLRDAAVLGQRFDFEILLALTGLGEGELLRALGPLVTRQIVVEERGVTEQGATERGATEQSGGLDRYRFRHALTREAVYDELLGRERRLKHQEALRVLEQRRQDGLEEAVDALAYHSLQARDLPKAARYARLAGDRAAGVYAYREAAGHYETVLELAEPEDPVERADLLFKLALARWYLGDTSRASRHMREAQAHYEAAGDRRKVSETHRYLSLGAWLAGHVEAAFEHLRAAALLLEAETPAPSWAWPTRPCRGSACGRSSRARAPCGASGHSSWASGWGTRTSRRGRSCTWGAPWRSWARRRGAWRPSSVAWGRRGGRLARNA